LTLVFEYLDLDLKKFLTLRDPKACHSIR